MRAVAAPDPARPLVVAGEALVDLIPGPDGTLAAHPGGGPYNAARTLARLGRPVAFLGPVSRDAFGRRLGGELELDGVRLHPSLLTDDATTLALAEVDADGAASYRFYTAATSAAGLTADRLRAALPASPAALHVGTLGLVLEPVASTLADLVATVADDVLVFADPNCRPAAIDDPAAYRARLARVLARTDVLKASEEDLAWLDAGRPALDAMRRLLADGSARVGLLTRGAAGTTVVLRDGEAVDVPAPQVDVVDTIGAGDSFGGGWLAWWDEQGLGRGGLGDGDAVVEAARFAARVAAITCSRAGADPPRRSELDD